MMQIPMNTKKKHILIIEDEVVHLDIMREKLEREGYTVRVAGDGEQGLQQLRSGGVDLVLLDMMLPKLDGIGVMEAMKKEHISVPIIIVSNSGQPIEVERARTLGARDFLIKAEFDPAEVLEKVRNVLGETPIEHTPASSASVAHTVSRQGVNILIVEDDKFLRDLVVKKLTAEGFTVHAVIDGEEGLTMMQKERPDLVLLDLLLPGIDGYEVLERMRRDPALSSIPVVVLSNLGQEEDVNRAMQLGVKDFLVKARYTPAEIVREVRKILNSTYINA